ncbi:NAD(P)-dependent oxidoreductase [Pusillimonas sp. ANT_WB101]|uniref:NAD(P)-dependent oxidoreductase n=1 Tax=Pusillimonas sp. ANT_WB101 TaxID=2597356 RepID=UPI0011EC435B|nr:NAD(P)-dependent oxidoreductase [Pusillimonas sp. ANT_WB101]KAA0890891.1 NAD(P)-dependent oxidoreductase [Pusillimonas sp. ANT_WB101]
MSGVVGFCGTGLMGAPMVRRLLAAGYRVRVWNRSPEKAQALAADGAIVVDSPQAAAQNAETVFLCLTDEAAVEATVFGDKGIQNGLGSWLVDHSSISPAATRVFATRLAKRGGRLWVDAPVSGGVAGASAGTLSIMAGGSEQAVRATTAHMQAYAGRITHVGETGAGQIAKLCNQTIVASTINAIAEAVALAQKSGINASILNTALAGGWADSVLLQTFVPRMTGPIDRPMGTVSTMLKDVENIANLAAESGVSLRGLDAVLASFREAANQGLGSADLSEIVRVAWPDKAGASTQLDEATHLNVTNNPGATP